MSLSRGTKVLLRSEKLTKNDWFRLVENRYWDIHPHLDRMQLPKLGKMEWLSHTGPLSKQGAVIRADPGYSLETRGIFPSISYIKDEERGKDGSRTEWGLDQDGNWLLITINYVVESLEGRPVDMGNGKTQPCPPGIFAEHASVIEIKKCDLETIADRLPEGKLESIWQSLASFVRDWFNAWEERYNRVKRLHEALQTDDALFFEYLNKLPK